MAWEVGETGRRLVKAVPTRIRRSAGNLFLSGFLRLWPQLRAPALPTSGSPHRVAGVALHADHLVQPATLGLREAGHMEGEAGVGYEGFGCIAAFHTRKYSCISICARPVSATEKLRNLGQIVGLPVVTARGSRAVREGSSVEGKQTCRFSHRGWDSFAS